MRDPPCRCDDLAVPCSRSTDASTACLLKGGGGNGLLWGGVLDYSRARTMKLSMDVGVLWSRNKRAVCQRVC